MERLVWLMALLSAIAFGGVFWLWRRQQHQQGQWDEKQREFESLLNQQRRENKERSQHLEQARQEIITLQQSQHQLSSQIQTLEIRLENSRQEKTEIETRLKAELQSLENSKQKLEQEFTKVMLELQIARDELVQKIQALQTQLDHARKVKSEIDSRLSNVENSNHQIEQEFIPKIAQLQAARDRLSQQIQVLENKLETAKQEKIELENKLTQEVQELTDKGKKIDDIVVDLKDKNSNLEKQLIEVMKHIQNKNEAEQKFIEDFSRLQAEAHDLKQELQKQEQIYHQKQLELEQGLNEKFQDFKKLEQGYREVEARFTVQTQQLELFREENQELKEENQELKNQFERQSEQTIQDFKKLEQGYREVEARFTVQTQQLELFREENQELKEENQELKNQFGQIIQGLWEFKKLADSCRKIQGDKGGKIVLAGKIISVCPLSWVEKIDPKPVTSEDLTPSHPYERILGKLAKYLSKQEWKKADQETVKILLEAAYKEDIDDLDQEAFASIPRQLWQAIDLLWRAASDQRFGFSLQQEFWWQVTGDGKGEDKTRKAFCERIGWRKNGDWLNLYELTYNLSAPVGHLPALGVHLGGLSWGVKHFSWGRRDSFEYFLSRIAIYADTDEG